MTTVVSQLLGGLATRRERLADLAAERPEERLVELLRQVDAVLTASEAGWGPPRAGAVGPEVPLEICLESFTPAELAALARDLERAAVVQRALLPPPQWTAEGWEVAWLWEPLGAVSGDHVDVLPARSSSEPVHLFVGDVAGKGVAASLLQSHLYALFRSLADPAVILGDVLARANQHLCAATTTAHYATLVGLRLHPDGQLDLANAGHPRPLLADRRGVRPIEGSGLPLGLFCSTGYAERRLELAPGDSLLLYTDGWTEAATASEEYGIGRAAAALRRARSFPLPELLAHCRADMEEFLAGHARPDDLTLVVVRRLG